MPLRTRRFLVIEETAGLTDRQEALTKIFPVSRVPLATPDIEDTGAVHIAKGQVIEGVARGNITACADLRADPGKGTSFLDPRHREPVGAEVFPDIVFAHHFGISVQVQAPFLAAGRDTLDLSREQPEIHVREDRGINNESPAMGAVETLNSRCRTFS